MLRKSVLPDDSLEPFGLSYVNTYRTSLMDALYTFTNTGNTYRIAGGDKLLPEYTGGNTSNFISLKHTDTDAFDGTKTLGTTSL